MIGRIFVFSVFIFVFYSCNKKAKSINFIEINFIDSVEVKIDSGLQFEGWNQIYQPYNKEYVYLIELEKCNVYKLDLLNFKLSKIGQYLIENPETFYIDESNNEICFIGSDSLYVFDFEGRKIKTTGVPRTSKGFLYWDSNNFNPLPINSNEVSFNFFADKPDTYTDSSFFDEPIECVWNQKSNQIKLLPVTYPCNYKKLCFGYNFIPKRIQIGKSNHGYCFDYNDSIYVLNLENQTTKAHFFGSAEPKEINGIPFHEVSNFNSNVFERLVTKNPSYPSLYYLNHQNVFCRIYASQREKEFYNWNLCFFDQNLNSIGEVKNASFGLFLADTKEYIYDLSFRDHILKCKSFKL